jgi:predicted TIM-barrel fold metal-dependent hydrolase
MPEQIRPPEPNTKTPKFTPPPRAADCAVHVFPPVSRFPVSEKRIYDPPTGADFSDLARMHRTLGVERGVIVQATAYRTDCRSTVAALDHFGKGYRGIVVLDDAVTDRELETLDKAGVRGVRFNFAKFLGLVPEIGTFKRVAGRIHELGWHVVLHVEPDDILEHAAMFRAMPNTFLIDHMAHLDTAAGTDQPAFKLIADLLRDGRWWIKLSNGDRMSKGGPPYADVVAIGRALAAAAPDRAIWGTDWPHVLYQKPAMVNDGDLMNLLGDYLPDETARRKVLSDNPNALYRFDA